jgi:site-specific recombinase XerD
MQKSKISLVHNRKNNALSGSPSLVQIKCYLQGKNNYISTGVYVAVFQWNNKKKEVIKHENSYQINTNLRAKISRLEAIEYEYQAKKIPYDFQTLKSEFLGLSNDSFLTFCKKEMQMKDLKEATINNHLATLSMLEKYENQTQTITFNSLSLEWLQKLDKYLLSKNMKKSSIGRHHQTIRSYINDAIKKGKIDHKDYPYKHYQIKSQKSDIIHLNEAQLQQLEQIAEKEKSIYVDMFLLGCYTSLRFADIQNLDKSTIKNEDYNYLRLNAQKTSKTTNINISVLFNGRAEKIINSYEESKPFLQVSNVQINVKLKEIGDKIGVKDLHFHVSRHTFATQLLEKGLDIVSVQELMQHSDINTTRIYAQLVNDQLNKNLLKLWN